jgi:3-hydroxyacyl-[acyl-carrier-protein] dehydratase
MDWRHVDAILEMEIGWRAVGEKTITRDGFLEGHFPGRPIQPGVLTLEGLIEVARHLIAETERASRVKTTSPELSRIEKASFIQIVVLGDRLILEAKVTQWNGGEVRVRGWALAGKDLKVEVIFVLNLQNPRG